VIKLNNANNEWKVNKLIVEKLDNEYQISVSNILKDSIGIFKDKKYNRILDLGCGTGRNSLFFAQHRFKVFASDISTELLEVLRNKVINKKI